MDPEAVAVQFVLNEPAERTRGLIRAIEAGQVGPSSSRARVAGRPQLGGTSLDRTLGLLRAWRHDDDGASRLSRLLKSLLEVQHSVEERATRAELVWTGHRPTGSPLRGTAPVLQEMFDSAESHVIVLSYSVWLSHSRVDAALDRLVAARRRGASVTFVIDRGVRPRHGR